MRDADGRLRPTQVVSGIFVMERRAGWSTTIPEAERNSDWDYAEYPPNGSVNTQANLQPCSTCHLSQRAQDFTFTTAA